MEYLINISKCEEIARLRMSGKKTFHSYRPLSQDYEVIGVMGEVAFSLFSGYPVDRKKRMSGDKGIDFETMGGLKIDVKTAKKAHYLIVEKGKVISDVYVLAQVEANIVDLLGWAWKKAVMEAPLDSGGKFKNGVKNHHIHNSDLEFMSSLKEYV